MSVKLLLGPCRVRLSLCLFIFYSHMWLTQQLVSFQCLDSYSLKQSWSRVKWISTSATLMVGSFQTLRMIECLNPFAPCFFHREQSSLREIVLSVNVHHTPLFPQYQLFEVIFVNNPLLSSPGERPSHA